MVLVCGLLLFALIAVVIWLIAVALVQTFLGTPHPREHRYFWLLSAAPVTLVTLVSFVVFPAGYLLTLFVWWLAARNFFGLPLLRALTLWLILALLSFVSRLALLGALVY